MVSIRPFAAIMPAHVPGEDVSPRTAPPYDVIGAAQREALLAADPKNVVALELPEGPLDPGAPGNRYEVGAARWRAWREEGALVSDDGEALYVLEQRFERNGAPVRRRAFVVAVGLEPFSARVVFPHERTLPKALDDRLLLTRACRANLSPVFGLFSDAEGATDRLFDDPCAYPPLLRASDGEGVESLVWPVRDPEAIARIAGFFSSRPVFIADGHHRYVTALAYRDERAADPDGGPDVGAAGGVLMALANMDDPGLVVLPAHRVVTSAGGPIDGETFRDALGEHFRVTLVSADEASSALDEAGAVSFVARTVSDGLLALCTLEDGTDPADVVPGDSSDEWKRLDVSVLQELVLRPLLDIDPERPETLDRLAYTKDDGVALATDDADVVFLMRPTGMDQLRAVALNGETMPQKSTYFYPKVLSGLLFRSLE